MNKKICFLNGVVAHSGGTERVGIMIANALAQRGFDVTILSFWDYGQPFFSVDERVTVDHLLKPATEGKLYRTFLYPVWKLRRYVKNHDFDVFIDIDSVLAYWTTWALRGLPCRHIVWDHFNYVHAQSEHKRIKALQLTMRHADTLVLLTQQDRRMYLEGGFPADKLRVINNPSPFEHVTPSPRVEHTVLAVGRLTEQKGFDRLIAAWSRIEDRAGDWKLAIVGSGELESELKRQVDDFGLSNVRFIPATSNIEQWYDNASIYAMTSRFEGFPMVLLEAMAKGLPIVAYDCLTGPSELVDDDVNGHLVQDGDEERFAENLLSLMWNRQLQDRYSYGALRLISDFSINAITRQWEELIDGLA
ncbi:glycosyltransferase family 4 protein [Bifidobacterium sp. SO4]|uniref:glycosyltransferase family 4 protein n=1 Tax=Bifidobacterium sp. SO4 TaxID=2809030 RepID=UPI001BDC4FB5|nr:glycosyltransferase family 4 protein [Bifidobacterium sp. SO4]MBT1169957.1 glycosyltransferase family 4 protein [Bifidobacterium sp. SO4]